MRTFSLIICLLSCFWHSSAQEDCASATTIVPTSTCNLINLSFTNATLSQAAPNCAINSSQDQWFHFVAAEVTNQIKITAKSGLNTGIELYKGSCSSSSIACVNANGNGTGEQYISANFEVGAHYYIRLFNANGVVNSLSTTFCVTSIASPSNDNCNNAQIITPQSTINYQTFTFAGSTAENTSANCLVNQVNQDVWFKFTATNATNRINVRTVTALNIGYEVYNGSCSGGVVRCVNTLNTGGVETSLNNDYSPGETYWIRVFNAGNEINANSIEVAIQTHPTPTNDVCANAQAITPSTDINYQPYTIAGSNLDGNATVCNNAVASQDIWFKFTAPDSTIRIVVDPTTTFNPGFEVYAGACNGTLLNCINTNGQLVTESSFTNNFIAGQEYYIRVFSVSNTLTTGEFNLAVQTFPNPLNDWCSAAQEIAPTLGSLNCTFITQTISGAMMDARPTSCGGANTFQDIWYKFIATERTMQVAVNTASSTDIAFEIIEETCDGPAFLCRNNALAGNSESILSNEFTIGKLYYLRIFKVGTTIGLENVSICVRKFPAPTNELCSNAIELTPSVAVNYYDGTFSGSDLEGSIPVCSPEANMDVWFKFQAVAESHTIALSYLDNRDLAFEVYEGSCDGELLICQNQYNYANLEQATLNDLQIGTYYYIRVIHAKQVVHVAGLKICVLRPACTPTLIITPSATSICPGETVTFEATITDGGVNPVFYWTVNSVLMNGNSSTFTLNNINSNHQVRCYFVSNAECAPYANTWSNIVTLSVVPQIQPTFDAIAPICAGTSFSLPTVSNEGISGTWSPEPNFMQTTTFTFTPQSGACASTTTMEVQVNNVTPTIAISSNTTELCGNGNATFSAQVTNEGNNPTYTWAVNGVEQTETSSTLNLTGLTNTITVNCQLTSDAACAYPQNVQSNQVVIVVNQPLQPTFNQISSICEGEVFTLPTTSNNGIAGTWSPAPNFTQTTTYTFTPNSDACAGSGIMEIEVVNLEPIVEENNGVLSVNLSDLSYQWFNCITEQYIVGSNLQTYNPTENGSYAVEVTVGSCLFQSNCVEVANLALNEIKYNLINIHPNPTNGSITIEMDAVDARVELTDLKGKTLKNVTILPGEMIDLSEYPRGIYILKIFANEHSFLERVVKM